MPVIIQYRPAIPINLEFYPHRSTDGHLLIRLGCFCLCAHIGYFIAVEMFKTKKTR
uniref:Uncharacterized protein n=1 Tax=Anguilla anguilla TaxID=7936 RepID=A0A0E9U4L2_ANGAN